MSGINGDKARFHKERKQKIAKRKRNREQFKDLREQGSSVGAAAGSKPKAAII